MGFCDAWGCSRSFSVYAVSCRMAFVFDVCHHSLHMYNVFKLQINKKHWHREDRVYEDCSSKAKGLSEKTTNEHL